MFHSCVAKFLFVMWICKTFEIYPCEEQRRMYLVILIYASSYTCLDCKRETKGSFLEWILQTFFKTRLRLDYCWVLTTLTLFTNRNQIYCTRDRRMPDIMKELETDFIFIEADQVIHKKVFELMAIEVNESRKKITSFSTNSFISGKLSKATVFVVTPNMIIAW